MATTPQVPKALTFDQLQKYKNANFTEFNNAFNQNNYGFKNLDDFASAHYQNFGMNEIGSGARANPFVDPDPAPAQPAPAPAPAPAPSLPPAPAVAPAAPPAAAPVSQGDFQAGVQQAVSSGTAAAPVVAPKPVTKEVDKSKTSAGLLNEMLRGDSDYLKLAKGEAMEEMSGRGLLSSSMAAGAATNAAIGAAKDFAMQDSNLYANQQLANQKYENDFALTGYESDLQKQLAAVTSALKGNEMRLGASLDRETARDVASLDLMKMRYGADLDIAKMGVAQGFDMEKLAFAQRADLEKLGVAQGFDIEKMRIGQGFDLEKLASANQYDLGKMAKANDYETQRLILGAQLDTDQKIKLAEITFRYDGLTRSSATASSFVAQHLTDVNRITSDPNIPVEQKQQLIDKALDALGQSMKVLDGIYKADFAGLVPTVPAAPAAPAS